MFSPEQAPGFEPGTFSLATRHSTAELRLRFSKYTLLAEEKGFEPPSQLSPATDFPGQPFKPLTHSSISKISRESVLLVFQFCDRLVPRITSHCSFKVLEELFDLDHPRALSAGCRTFISDVERVVYDAEVTHCFFTKYRRKRWDSNPWTPFSGASRFRDGCLQPLGHVSNLRKVWDSNPRPP